MFKLEKDANEASEAGRRRDGQSESENFTGLNEVAERRERSTLRCAFGLSSA
jgi:hypothetical protein